MKYTAKCRYKKHGEEINIVGPPSLAPQHLVQQY